LERIVSQTWDDVYASGDVNQKVEMFQSCLVENYHKCFPVKIFEVCDEDDPWITVELKKLSRQRKSEFLKHKNSPKWKKLNDEFLEKFEYEKEKYYENIVSDLKTSNVCKWFSKVKRMSGRGNDNQSNIMVEELRGQDNY
jgi:hypothetical protein